ncbi:tetratricopeptide repeat protein, partial [Vibrio parahaemolyticus]|uniref:tetratricopeptide repeat protein n=1 Tax=Vibrio parahaemolyticus TaxID=670 RepID=UPI0015DF3431
MSAINKALSELAEKTSPSELTRAEIPNVSRSKPWLWLVAGFSLSLAVGGWAVSQGPAPSDEITSFQPSATQPLDTTNADRLASSPTNKMTPETSNVVYSKPVEKPQAVAALPTPQPSEGVFGSRADADMSSEAPMLIAQVANAPSNTTTNLVEESSMRIEQVELSHRQLSLKAISRAEKAIDANDMETALSAYTEALRYDPSNIETRQKLAALYFGKGDTRKSYEILQEGINLDKDNQPLRLALSKLLVKANQPSAALSPL